MIITTINVFLGVKQEANCLLIMHRASQKSLINSQEKTNGLNRVRRIYTSNIIERDLNNTIFGMTIALFGK